MKRVLVGVDGSPSAGAALRWAARLARPSGAEVIVATAFWPSEGELPPDRYGELAAEARTLEGAWSAPARDEGVEWRAVLCEGQPDVLLEAADAEDADLVVVGTRGRGGFAGLNLGSVAHHLAHNTTRPLAVVPAPSAAAPLERVVVGVDGSEGAAEAVRWCADALGPLGVAVVAVHAVPSPMWEDDPRGRPGVAEDEVREWVAPIIDAGLDVTPVVMYDTHPVAALTQVADQHRAGLIVVGSRGRGGFLGLRLGRVSLQLLHQTAVPLVMVPSRR